MLIGLYRGSGNLKNGWIEVRARDWHGLERVLHCDTRPANNEWLANTPSDIHPLPSSSADVVLPTNGSRSATQTLLLRRQSEALQTIRASCSMWRPPPVRPGVSPKRATFRPCSQKRTLLFAEHLTNEVLLDLPHRQFVFTRPKALRPFFRHDRRLFTEVSRLIHTRYSDSFRSTRRRSAPVRESGGCDSHRCRRFRPASPVYGLRAGIPPR